MPTSDPFVKDPLKSKTAEPFDCEIAQIVRPGFRCSGPFRFKRHFTQRLRSQRKTFQFLRGSDYIVLALAAIDVDSIEIRSC